MIHEDFAQAFMEEMLTETMKNMQAKVAQLTTFYQQVYIMQVLGRLNHQARLTTESHITAAGYQPHPLDQCLYCLFHGDQLVSMIGIHVDDLIGAGLESDEVYQKAKQALHESFNFKHWAEGKETGQLQFCDCDLEADGNGGWWLRQQAYVQKIKPLTLSDLDENCELTVEELTMLRGLLGALQWPATQTSPHLSASVSFLCGDVSAATVSTAT